MTLHDRIMALAPDGWDSVQVQAAQLATEADELMAEMAEELKWYRADKDAEAALQKYNAYKEQ